MQDMWQVSCWHEGYKKKEQGLALLKKTEEILASKNNNQSKAKTQRESTRMHHVKVAQSCVVQKGANPPKTKVSEYSKDAVCEQQNASRKCSNEYVATKKQGRSRYDREDSSKITKNTRTCYKSATVCVLHL